MLVRCILWIFIVFGLLLPATLAHAAKAPVGTIVEVEGTATITRGPKTVPAALEAEIYVDDIVTTGPQSRVFILLFDDTEWTLSENTKFRVDDFVYDSDDDEDNAARYNVLQGAFRYVSGLVAKKDAPDVNISTPYGSIGIRGTDITGAPQDGGGYGIHVDEGSVNVENAGGATLLRRGEGSRLRDRATAPGRAERFSREDIDKMRARVRLARQEQLRARLPQMRAQQREKLKAYVESIKGRLQEMRQRRGDRMQGQKEERQDRLQDRREKLQDRTQQRRERMRRYRYNQ